MEGKWPSKTTSSHMWNKLRNFFAAVYELQRLGKLRSKAGKQSVEGVSTEVLFNTPLATRTSFLTPHYFLQASLEQVFPFGRRELKIPRRQQGKNWKRGSGGTAAISPSLASPRSTLFVRCFLFSFFCTKEPGLSNATFLSLAKLSHPSPSTYCLAPPHQHPHQSVFLLPRQVMFTITTGGTDRCVIAALVSCVFCCLPPYLLFADCS